MGCQQTETGLIIETRPSVKTELLFINCGGHEANFAFYIGGRLIGVVDSFDIWPASLDMVVDQVIKCFAKALTTAGQDLDVSSFCVWDTANSSIALVDQIGNVTAVAVGTTSVIATLTFEDGSQFTDSIPVTIT